MERESRDGTEETRAALEAAALRLVARNGMEATTAAEIAAAVGVSERTFFRYFVTKHDAILGYIRERAEAALSKLDTHCGERVDLGCVIDALRSHATELAEDEGFVRRMRVINSDPTLRAELQKERLRFQDMLSTEIAKRWGGKPDLRSQVLASTAVAIVTVGVDAWIEDPQGDEIGRFVDNAAREIRDGSR